LGIHLELGVIESAAFVFGLILVFGVVGGRVAQSLRFPAITGYLIFGILLNPQVSHFVSPEAIGRVEELVTPIALSFIAFAIGGSLRLDKLRGLLKTVGVVTLVQGIAPFLFILLLLAFLAPVILGTYLPELAYRDWLAMALAAGAIALATAPAAVIAVCRELKAKGPLVTTVLAVVALDDGMAIMAFALVAGFGPLLFSGGGMSLPEIIGPPLYDIVGSLLLGLLFALIFIFLWRLLRRKRVHKALVVFIFVAVCGGVAQYFELSIILANMAFGFVIVNRTKSPRMIDVVVGIEDIVFILFFTLAGATFLAGEAIDGKILTAIAVIGAVIVLGRCIGKFSGSWLGASVAGSPTVVKKYLGYALLPKAGVSIALATALGEKEGFESISSVLIGAIIFSTIINELISPPLAKYGILKSGEGRAAAPR
jgi:Kef-type K+ transport system membrane component KefB